jgi:YHS domain-containing protein
MKKQLIIHHLVWMTAQLVFGSGLFGGSGTVHAGGQINTGYFGGIAIKGYDPVAYFTKGRAMKGSEEFAHEWLGETWHFANARHRDLFAADPVKYAPPFGGYCALGVAYGQNTANIDPEAWRIINGKLYLTYDKGGAAELEEIPGELNKAKANWPKVKAKLAQ